MSEIELRQTCGACPEQYDAFLDGEQVGYLRLRHGSFTVEVPDAGGETIYMARPQGDGIFGETEREHYLDMAKEAITAYRETGSAFSVQRRSSLRDILLGESVSDWHGGAGTVIEIPLDTAVGAIMKALSEEHHARDH